MKIIAFAFLVFASSCSVQPADDPRPSSRSELKREGETVLIEDVLFELADAQCSQPTEDDIVVDPKTEIFYDSIDELDKLASVHDCATDPDSAPCASIQSAQETHAGKLKPGCTKRQFLGGKIPGTVVIRTCITCCKLTDNGASCTTKCTKQTVVIK